MKATFYPALIFFMCLISANGFAQGASAEVNIDSQQALGIHFGNVSGNGLSYRYFFEKIGLQAVFGGYNTGTNTYSFPAQIMNSEPRPMDSFTRVDKGRKYSLNFGLNAIYPLKKTDAFNFYIAGGFCWKYSNEMVYSQDYTLSVDSLKFLPTGSVREKRDVENLLNIGFGPGVELPVGKFFRLSVEIPITYTGRHQFIMYVPQAGIYYYFK